MENEPLLEGLARLNGAFVIREELSEVLRVTVDRIASFEAPVEVRFDRRARKAAEAVAAYETRFASWDLKIEGIDGRLTLIQWMLALLIGGVASLMVKAFV